MSEFQDHVTIYLCNLHKDFKSQFTDCFVKISRQNKLHVCNEICKAHFENKDSPQLGA